MSKTSKVHGPYYLEYKDWSGGYRPVRDAKTSGYATKYKTITEARKKAVLFIKYNSCQLVGIQGEIGKRTYGRDGRPTVQGGTAGIVEREYDRYKFIYRDYNSGKTYNLNGDGSTSGEFGKKKTASRKNVEYGIYLGAKGRKVADVPTEWWYKTLKEARAKAAELKKSFPNTLIEIRKME